MDRIIALVMICVLMTISAYADGTHPAGIKLDGTIGNAGKINLPGPDYQIKAELGKQSGANLFHSFEQFNLHNGESATFSGPDSVKNIISRVTGGSASWIDGKLASTIPNADLYFLNPFGIMFGSNASLDLKGSFHVSTADYLRLGDNERFYAAPQQNEVLSVAAPNSFGFLSEKPAKISIEGASLQVPDEKSLSLIGGDIEIRKATLKARGGRIDMVSMASPGETAFTEAELDLSVQPKGNITISDYSAVDIRNGGSTFIRGGQIDIRKNSGINADSAGDKHGGVTDIRGDSLIMSGKSYISAATSGTENAGDIAVESGNLQLIDTSYISSSTSGTGNGGSVNIRVDKFLSASGYNSGIFADSVSTKSDAGNAGSVDIQAEQIQLAGGSQIRSITWGGGSGGSVNIIVDESFVASGYITNEKGTFASGVLAGSYGTEAGGGNAGSIDIQAENIRLKDQAQINSSTAGAGSGGSVSIGVGKSFEASGYNSGIFANSNSTKSDAGDAGNIDIRAGQILLKDSAQIGSITSGAGAGGMVKITAGESFVASGYVTNEKGTFSSGVLAGSYGTEAGAGNAGSIDIQAGNVQLKDQAQISSSTSGTGEGGSVKIRADRSFSADGYNSGVFANSNGTKSDAGNAGSVDIQAEQMQLTDGARISSSTSGTGEGGSVKITAGESFEASGYITNEKGTFASGVLAGSYGTEAGGGNAGSIDIQAENIRLKDQAKISSITSGTGEGGSIKIRVDQSFVASGSSSGVFANSQGTKSDSGRAGSVDIQAGQIQLSGGAQINSFTRGSGEGGVVNIRVRESFSASGYVIKEGGIFPSGVLASSYSDTENAGAGGKISLSAQKVQISDKGKIASASAGGGQAGDIALNISHLEMYDNALISSDSEKSGGGRISVNAEDTVYLTDSSITTNVAQGVGKGGDITIGNPDTGIGSQFVILNNSRIQANAGGEGDGGAVFIVTDNFLKSFNSIIEATSARGNEGTVKIEAPDFDISGSLTVLPGTFFDAEKWVSDSCESRSGKYRGRFTIRRYVVPPDPLGDSEF